MDNKTYRKFYICSLIGVIIGCFYPIYMGIRVVGTMMKYGFVPTEKYPKYVIPYTPIAIALILGVLMIPVFQKLSEKRGFLFGLIFSTIIFFIPERWLEVKVLIGQQGYFLESWQMSMCAFNPELYSTRTWREVDVLLGGYSPAFKLHFYMISMVLIASLLNCFYGFAGMIRRGDYTRKKPLILQSVTSLSFLGMCIFACFTAFYRTGELLVAHKSAALMVIFFALLGITMGIFTASFTMGKKSVLSIWLPAFISVLTVVGMYIGEMILLHRNLYRFGNGFLFDSIGALVLAPVDLLVIVISGCITALICKLVNPPPPSDI